MIFVPNRDGVQVPRRAGFSLLELLVVIGLIAALSAAFIGGLTGGKTVALQAGQAAISNLVTGARSRALANGSPTRILLNQERVIVSTPPRFLRYLVLQEQVGGVWQTVTDLYLPDGVYLLPQNPDGSLFGNSGQWTTSRATALHSLAFGADAVPEIVNSNVAEQWSVLAFSATGTPAFAVGLSASEPRSLVLTIGRALPPGSATPIVFDNPENVRGLSLSNYGVPIFVNERSGF